MIVMIIKKVRGKRKLIQKGENKWYVMFKDRDVLNAMQNDFENWVEFHRESYESEGVDTVLDRILSMWRNIP
jgi:hypothetical protein